MIFPRMTCRVIGRSVSALVRVLLLSAAPVTTTFGQGTVTFANHLPTVLITHVYLPLPADPYFFQMGNGTADLPGGTTDWTGWTPVSGSGFSAQLFAATGAGAPVSSLAPAFPVTTFRTGAAAGFVVSVVATLTGVAESSEMATVQMRVWDNQGGTVTDWAAALSQPAGTELVGVSAPLNIGPIGSATTSPTLLVGLQSFDLTYIPEPSALTVAGLGAIVLSIARLTRRGRGTSSKPR